jgi:hypothetical protein
MEQSELEEVKGGAGALNIPYGRVIIRWRYLLNYDRKVE